MATLRGTSKADSLKGRNRDDEIYGFGGDDRLDGGAGNDLVYGGNGDDRVRGGSGDDKLYAGDGVDRVDGRRGDDVVTYEHHYFNAGDIATGGSGNDTLVVEYYTDSTFRVKADGITTLPSGARFSGFENFHVNVSIDVKSTDIETLGGDDIIDAWFNDKISSGAGDDQVAAWHGSDTVDLGSGDDYVSIRYDGIDVVRGGRGNDTIHIDAGVDISAYEGAALSELGDLTLTVANTKAVLTGGKVPAIYTSFETIQFASGAGDDRVTVAGSTRLEADGGAGADVLRGGRSDDDLRGGAGRDALEGGRGSDQLTGGTGGDTFRYATLNNAIDTITDFSNVSGNNDSFTFARGALGVDSDYRVHLTLNADANGDEPQFVFDAASGQLAWDVDGEGGADAQVIATLNGVPSLSASDFILV